ncbi:MAG: glycoside hydrolase family 127 protein [Bacilli bacterium]|nr:glycoside hydrolase family 127 protein [Bacilli bacterium]
MKPLNKMTAQQINLQGYALDVLKKQANGLTGHMEEVWEDLGPSSAWLGGTKEDWERGPYYFDGLVALVFLVKDGMLLQKAHRWVQAICDSQEVSGFFGPKSNRDWWPRIVATKGLLTYYQNTKDKQVLLLLERFFCYMEKMLPTEPLYFWAHVRGLEMMPALECVIRETANKNCVDLASQIQKYCYDWNQCFQEFPYRRKTKYYLNRPLFLITKPLFVLLDKMHKNKKRSKQQIVKSQKNYFNQQFLLTHGVNIAMAVKYPAYTKKPDIIPSLLAQLQKDHGNATLVFSSDEHLNGSSPLQGMELCTAAELLYSLEEIIRVTGDLSYADQAEWIATNILPAYFSQDFCSHQYIQQVNQTSAGAKKGPFFDVGRAGTMFGLAPHFGCCAANMHQAFPKFLSSGVLYDRDCLYFTFYIPGTYTLAEARWEIITDYPFSDEVEIRFSHFTKKQIYLRLPYGVRTRLQIDGKEMVVENEKGYCCLVEANTTIKMHFDFEVSVITNPDQSFSVKRGPILFAQELSAIQTNKKGKPPYQDRIFTTKDKPVSPFSNAHELEVEAVHRIADPATLYGFSMHLICRNKKDEKQIKLVWYGQTVLRIAQWEENK